MNTDKLADAIADSLYLEMKAAGWNNKTLAPRLGLSEQTLGRYLTRKERALPVDVLVNACHVIGVEVAVVVRRAEERMDSWSPPESGAV